jgi:hypothetical protein
LAERERDGRYNERMVRLANKTIQDVGWSALLARFLEAMEGGRYEMLQLPWLKALLRSSL